MSDAFSEKTLGWLRQAGWEENRRIDPAAYVAYLSSQKFPIHDKAVQFWTEFGGLRVTHPHRKVPGEDDSFELDPVGAARRINRRNLQRFSRRVGAPLCVVGDAHRGYMTLMMDPHGVVYAGLDGLLQRVGHSGAAAIEALCSGQEPEELP